MFSNAKAQRDRAGICGGDNHRHRRIAQRDRKLAHGRLVSRLSGIRREQPVQIGSDADAGLFQPFVKFSLVLVYIAP